MVVSTENMNFLRRRKKSDDDDLGEETVSRIQKSRKPPNTAFRQQRLKAWQPILTPKTVIPFLFLLAAIFAPLGVAIVYYTYNVEKLQIDYSKCATLATDSYAKVPSKYTNWHFRHKNTDPDFQWRVLNGTDADGDRTETCFVKFNLPRDLKPPIYLYYRLTNFYQNHRKYVDSVDPKQIAGHALDADSLSTNCKPLRLVGDGSDEKVIYPCGLIANSLFNDTFSSPVLLNSKTGSDNETYVLTSKGISWASDRKHQFKKTTYKPEDIVPPPNWAKMFPQGYNLSNIPDLSQWEQLQNWMRTAGLPTFFKLYLKNTTTTFTLGTYEIQIGLNYPASMYGGTKSLVITTNSVFGGRNMTLGIVYLIVAIVCLVCAIGFFLQHLIKPRRIGNHNFLQEGGAEQAPAHFREQL